MLIYSVAPLWRCGAEGGHGCWRGRAERGFACLISDARPQSGWFPLHFAAKNGHPTVIKKLLAAGATTDVKNEVCAGGEGQGSRGHTYHFVSSLSAFTRKQMTDSSLHIVLTKSTP